MLVSGFIEIDNKPVPDAIISPLPELSGSSCLLFSLHTGGKRLIMKRLKPELAGNPRYVEAFQKEYETGARLSHPNLVHYCSMSDDIDGCYIIMDYVDGLTLEEFLARNPQHFAKPQQLLHIFTQLLSCLDYLHSRQILHLDLKLDNLLITRVSNDLKVIDLGCCYTDSYNGTMGRNLAFSAPEQLNGSGHIDVRSDLYAVGRLLEHIAQQPSVTYRAKLQPIIARATATNPAQRYPSAQAMLAALTKVLQPKRSSWGIAALFAAIPTILLIVIGLLTFNKPKAAPNTFVFEEMTCAILSEDSLTCSLLDVSTSLPEHADGQIIIYSPVHYGENYYTIADIADSLLLLNPDVRAVGIPEGVTCIGSLAFFGCENLLSVSLPSTLRVIEHDAFSSCHKLQHITLPAQLKQLHHGAFVGCYKLRYIEIPEGIRILPIDCFVSAGLREIKLPESLTALERGVFYDCKSLQRITLPAGLHTLGDFCFYDCDSLLEVTNLSLKPQSNLQLFNHQDSIQRTLRVPAEALERYRQSPAWNHFSRIVAI
ncbi:MAG: leucine-rich repeat protein [Bacteroidales bacterium]|nr:leucine-rich repeat protein [Bacteroidales bacterium]